jgi:uncharacterized protein (TIGR00251 family)
MLSIKSRPGSVSIKVHVQPGASRNQVLGLHGDALKLKLIAPPVEGKANRACIEFLSEALGVPKTCIQIVSGHSSRRKQIRISCSARQTPQLSQRLEDLSNG